MVEGDLFPKLVTSFSDLLAIPLTKIYNLIKATYLWPTQWQVETVTVVPRYSTASTFEEFSNLSCTLLFSKMMESYMIDQITKEVTIDLRQKMRTRKPTNSSLGQHPKSSGRQLIVGRPHLY